MTTMRNKWLPPICRQLSVATRSRRRAPFDSLMNCALLVVVLLISLSGLQADAQQNGQASPNPPADAENISIAPGDLLEVNVFKTPELSGRLRVDQSGRVVIPVAGPVSVKGMTVSAASAAIAETLRTHDIMLQPSVTVAVLEYATEGVTVLGEVRNPGIYTLLGSHSLYDALASAGGVTQSQGSNIAITHAGNANHPLYIDVSTPNYSAAEQSTLVQPGDTIVVSRADLVYAVGDVVHSGAFYIQSGQHLTVLNLLSLAQGTNRTAAMSHAALIRASDDGARTIAINLNKVMKNQEANLVLQAGDVLVVPRSGLKSFSEVALPGLTSAVSGAASTALIIH